MTFPTSTKFLWFKNIQQSCKSVYYKFIGIRNILLSNSKLISKSTLLQKQTTYYILMPLWGLTNGVAAASHLGFVSDLCTEKQVPLLFGMKCFLKGLGGASLISLGGKKYFVHVHTRTRTRTGTELSTLFT